MSKDLQQLHGEDLVDALLGDWPVAERSALEWDDFAERIMARLDTDVASGVRSVGTSRAVGQEGDEEVTPDANYLLAPDLNGANTSEAEAPVYHPVVPATPSVGGAARDKGTRRLRVEESMGAQSQRDRRSSLQDLAKLANEGPRSQRNGNGNGNGPDSFAAAPMSARSSGRVSEGSGVVDLQSLSVLPSTGESAVALPHSDTFAAAPSSASPLASAPVISEAVPPSLQESVPPMPMSIAPATLSDSGITPPASRRMSGPGLGVIAGGIVGVLAVAAGALFFVVSKKAPANETAAASTAITAPAEQKPVETAAVAPVADVAAIAQAEAKPADVGTDPTALPTTATETGSRSHGSSAAVAAAAPVSAADSKKAAKEEKLAKEKAPKVAAAEPAPAPPSGIPDNALGAALKQAGGPGIVGSGVENKSDAQFAAGSVPQRPSQGTLTSALGRVLGKAKACIGPDDPISRAAVVFASAGTVQSVTVSGNAAGKPAEACIKTALTGAKLNTPFAEPTYTTTVTIRP